MSLGKYQDRERGLKWDQVGIDKLKGTFEKYDLNVFI